MTKDGTSSQSENNSLTGSAVNGRAIPPPALPRAERAAVDRPNPGSGVFARFGDDFGPLETAATPLRVAEALLKRPARVVYEIGHGHAARLAVVLLAIVAACLLAYGLLMGMFSGGPQLWAVPLKVLAGALASALICLPSLYIFVCLSGGDQSFGEVWGLLLSALALCAILLVGFAPIAWIFSQSTNTLVFMGILHLVFWLTAICFGLRLLKTAFAFLNRRSVGILGLWGMIFIAVVLQMSTTLRPLVGEYKGLRLEGKQFFLAHWMDSPTRSQR